MTQIKYLIEYLKTYDPEDHICSHLWQSDDVIHQAREHRKGITQEIAEQIIDEMDNKIDAELGVTWLTIDCYLDMYRNKLPKFWKLYWRSDDGSLCSYDEDKQRTIYLMGDPEMKEWQAETLAWRCLFELGFSDKLDDEELWWTITEMEPEDSFWEDAEDPEANERWELLTNPVVIAVNGDMTPIYATPRCPHCGVVLNKVDEVYTESASWLWDHRKNMIHSNSTNDDITTERYECPECLEDIDDYFNQFDVRFG